MSFWNTSTGESAVTNSTSFEIEGGGDFVVIPAGTKLMAIVEGVKVRKFYESEAEYVEIKWGILKPDTYNKQKIFQKCCVLDFDPAADTPEKAKNRRDKHIKLFATIDTNAGGKLSQSNEKPTDDTLALALMNKQMVIGVNTWDDRETKKPKGNWVYSVAPKGTEITSEEEAANNKPAPVQRAQSAGVRDLDDEIPF